MTDFTRDITGFRDVQTRFGDTLQAVALRELSDAESWSLLAWFNNLVPPYLTDDPAAAQDGVLVTGTTIRVPAATAFTSAAVAPDAVFLTDCALDKGQLQGANGDLALVAGRSNLHQAISNRIATNHGELVFHGTYGANLRRLIGELSGPVRELVATQYVQDALADENRIQTVNAVAAATQGDRLVINAEVVPISGANLNVSKVV